MSEITIRLDIEPLAEGGYVATSPDVQGLVAEGRSLVEVVEIAQDVARVIVEVCIEHGDPVPEIFRPLDERLPIQLTVPIGVTGWVDSPDFATRMSPAS